MSEGTVELKALVRKSRRWSTVWVVPLVALALGVWLVWEHYRDLGPLVYVRFETAESMVSGKTEVRCRSVRIGNVEKVELADDLNSVVALLRIDPESRHLLRGHSRFWVVKPRVSGSDVSGLGTIITGSYVELDPGDGREGVHHFDGLETPPVTSSSVPGLRLTLVAESAGSLVTGAPVYHKGFEVGRVERRTFDMAEGVIRFDVFIEERYAQLVTEGTCFWNTSGIDISAGAEGFRIRTPSFQAMVSGGASFAVPAGGKAGSPVKNGTQFQLFRDEGEIRDAAFTPDRRCLLFFDRSVRGLRKGAPVEFRGIQLGRVVDISFKYNPLEYPNTDPRVPVLIEIDPSLLLVSEQQQSNKDKIFADSVKRGLRAKLGTGSLLTGALFIDLDFVPEAPPAELGRLGVYEVIPTHSSGLVQLEAKVNAILDKIERMPLEDTLVKFGRAADEVATAVAETKAVLEDLHVLLENQETQRLPGQINETLKHLQQSVASLGPNGAVQGDLHRTLDELRAALRAFKNLSNTVEDKPNSLIFGRESTSDVVPKARR